MLSKRLGLQPVDRSRKVPRNWRMLWHPLNRPSGEFKWQNEGSGYAYRVSRDVLFAGGRSYDFGNAAQRVADRAPRC